MNMIFVNQFSPLSVRHVAMTWHPRSSSLFAIAFPKPESHPVTRMYREPRSEI